ncbi:MAG: rRNA methyltransferase, partial [Clostridia bacterium]|nr:rRNA methyltransferase [Clostridia bacterium]
MAQKNLRIRTRDAAYQKLEVLSTNRNKRYRYFEFLIEGVRNINEAVKNGWDFSSLIFSPEAQLSDWAKNTLKTVKTDFNIELSAPLMAELSEKEDTSELMAV